MTLELSVKSSQCFFFVFWERYGRASGRFGGGVSYVGEFGGNQERLGQTLLLSWVFLVRPCFKLVAKLLPNCFLRGANPSFDEICLQFPLLDILYG
jgi:hypothetical protein